MKKLLLFLLLSSGGLWAQSFYQFPQPFPNAVFRVCSLPAVGNPCSNTASIFQDQAESLPITQPVQVGKDGNYGFWVNSGQYTIQIQQPYNLVYTITLGGGTGGSIGGSGTVGTLPKFVTNATTLGNSLLTDNGSTLAYSGTGGSVVGSFTPAGCVGVSGGCTEWLEGNQAGTPTSGRSYCYPDNSTSFHLMKCSLGGGAERFMIQATNLGAPGQPYMANGDGTATAADPAISVNTVTLFSGQAATGTQTSAAITNPLRSGVGWLVVVLSAITGSPSSCQIALAFNQAGSNVTEGTPFFTQNITTALGSSYVGYKISPTLRLQGDNIVATYSCAAYPSGGTITASFNGRMPVDATGQLLNSAIYDSTGTNPIAVRQGGGIAADYALVVGAHPNSPFVQGLKGSTFNNQSAIQCDKALTGSDSSSGSTQLIAGVGGQNVHVCSLHLYSSSTTAVTAKLVASATSGNACATSPIDLSAAVTLQALTNNSPVGTNISPPSDVDWSTATTNAGVSNGAVCLNLSAAQTVTYQVNYAQF